MINVDDRLLTSGISPDQLFLLLHIAKFMNADMTCFPSNKKLCEATKWGLSKMNDIKKSLIIDGYLKRTERFANERQISNIYIIETEFLGIHVNLKGKGGEQEDGYRISGTPLPESRNGGTANPTTEVLTNEVLVSSSLTPEQKLKIWSDEIRANPKTKTAYTRARGLKIENFESDFEKWLAEAEAAPEKYEDRASVVKHFLNHACQGSEKSKKNYAGPAANFPAKSNKVRTIEPTGNYAPESEQFF